MGIYRRVVYAYAFNSGHVRQPNLAKKRGREGGTPFSVLLFSLRLSPLLRAEGGSFADFAVKEKDLSSKRPARRGERTLRSVSLCLSVPSRRVWSHNKQPEKKGEGRGGSVSALFAFFTLFICTKDNRRFLLVDDFIFPTSIAARSGSSLSPRSSR